ncbi:alcohol dehydrogenase, propanol-preferring/NAD+-dependent secondary alcohol dehydrogenase Adh1 [Natronoarchaeum philippinense]|uniref:Alcohol dehydrogenase, propanol-preferring/NAD+-dependent secondary alcohol dehydrogenase Adh1 n=1 Tax=Natronoarchaeum philippinense TaxID=558529 RepID=A0A285N6R4_NATPI|nr:NAD(P)-dependent alcohol dehydrogenase [Natronoarchaeum philippinense]SNZ05164.1 alcohol dehydrogenase, propanol-preferring/NAD+-dependent secondary alcohol dehydrogenase Adh1 [Natronoarchaeum philippinense]
MQAARLHEYTEEMSEGLSIDEVDRPEPTRSDHVVVEVEGAGWCQTDNHIIEGMWTPYVDQDLPMTLGHENAGTIVEVGDEVTTVEEGEQVICHPVMTCGKCRACRTGDDMYCENLEFPGLNTDGGFAEYLLTSERSVIPLDTVDPVEIAPHADAGITAYHAAKKAVDELYPGSYSVAIGIGGLGHIGVQALDAMSAAEIVAVDIKDEALDLAEECGADYTVNSTDEDVVEAVESITEGDGATQILDFVGADETTSLGPDIVAPGGDHHIVGYGGDIHQPAQDLVDAEMAYRGTLVGKYSELEELVALVEQGTMDLHTSEYSLDEINEVAEKLEHREIEGRAVIKP